MVKQLGDGTYGTVWKAVNRQSNEVVSWIAVQEGAARPWQCSVSHTGATQSIWQQSRSCSSFSTTRAFACSTVWLNRIQLQGGLKP